MRLFVDTNVLLILGRNKANDVRTLHKPEKTEKARNILNQILQISNNY